MRSRLAALLVVFALSLAVYAQTPDAEPTRTDAPVPVITFDLALPGANPAHYAISVESTGRASYRSDGGDSSGAGSSSGDEQPYTTQFTMTDAIKRQIFDLARQVHYFQGDFEFKGGRIANTGAKTLSYSEGPQAPGQSPTNGKHFKTTYNYSQNPAIQQITTIFQRISTTVEFGNRLAYEHRFDRMSLEGELKRMEEMQKTHDVLEIQAIEPILRKIADDANVFNVTRQRAIRLLKAGGAEVAQR